ncbi:NADH-quinone oxidoreductase subunit M [Candidatus Magnetobacterium casense]|uniref:NADH-quinone oxidoreductase subunit M n=1 Tax=Candidatus Magnetobacterium casense TaxID=1455061 RepID=UPI0006970843|nr:NADH-quinone oxidoreductase subunit M [Candidatus Magnetobacterium casensis]
MRGTTFPILSLLIFVPILGAALMALVSRRQETLIKWIALVVSVTTMLLTVPLFMNFNKGSARLQFVEKHVWIESWNVQYYIGIDGISVLMVLLSALTAILCVLISWNSIKEKVKEFFIAIILVEGSMIGVFCSIDIFLFYIFWEAMLIPMYLIVGIWGGKNRIYAAIKFFLYTLVGSVLMLIAIIILYVHGDTFDLTKLMSVQLPFNLQLLLFWLFFAAFAVKVPMFPVHTWLPDAHTEAPTAGSVILAAILIKMGAYGFLRFSLPLFPQAAIALTPTMLTLSVIAIVYGGLICMVQSDFKRLIAYSSVSHMGFVTLGIFSLNVNGIEGGLLQMINHGIVTGALFLCIGMVYDRTHTRQISDYGGLASVMPVFSSLFIVFTFASIGLPGTNGFIGEFLILLGGFARSPIAAIVASSGIIIGAIYMLWLYQRVFFTTVNEKIKDLKDVTPLELVILLPLLVLVLWIGVYPETFISMLNTSVTALIDRVHGNTLHESLTWKR